MVRSILVGTLLVVPMVFHNTSAAEKKEHETLTTGYHVGQMMPRHTVDFIGGTRDSGCGCPAVMIKNSGQRGFIIWSSGADAEATKLASLLDVVIGQGERERGFLVLFDQQDQTAGKLRATLHKFDNVLVCHPRSSGEKAFAKAADSNANQLIIFVLDNKEIKQKIELSSEELNKRNISKFFEETKQSLNEDD